MSDTMTCYLVVGADKSVRAVKRPRAAADEVMIPIRLKFPSDWGLPRIAPDVSIAVPEFIPEPLPEVEP